MLLFLANGEEVSKRGTKYRLGESEMRRMLTYVRPVEALLQLDENLDCIRGGASSGRPTSKAILRVLFWVIREETASRTTS